MHIAGIRVAPDGAWMKQIVKNLLDPVDGFLRHATHLIHDRDPLFTEAWTQMLASAGVEGVPIPASSPNCNQFAERFIRSVRAECLEHSVVFGERHLRHLLGQFVHRCHAERYHHGLGGKLIRPNPAPANDNRSLGTIAPRAPGRLVQLYFRDAA